MMIKKSNKKFILTFSYIVLFGLLTISLREYNIVFSDDDPEEPHVSLLTAKYRQGMITIYFEPLLDADLRYRIYRSKTLIKDESALDNATLISEISK